MRTIEARELAMKHVSSVAIMYKARNTECSWFHNQPSLSVPKHVLASKLPVC